MVMFWREKECPMTLKLQNKGVMFIKVSGARNTGG